MHQDDTYTTQATNDKNEAAPFDAPGEAKIDTAGVDTTEAAGTGKAAGVAEARTGDESRAKHGDSREP